jgi:hypothetical protein
MATVRSILQIIPARNWSARFDSSKRPSPSNAKQVGNAGFYDVPLACWALVEIGFAKGKPNRAVVGMIQRLPKRATHPERFYSQTKQMVL